MMEPTVDAPAMNLPPHYNGRALALALGAAFSALYCVTAMPAGERFTQKCNGNFSNGEVLVEAPSAARDRLIAVANDPRLDPGLYEAMWRPMSGRLLDFLAADDQVILAFESVQDTAEIAQTMGNDVSLRALGVQRVTPNTSRICFGLQTPRRFTITEFYHPSLDHFFLSSSGSETLAIDSGAAGVGWQRTGEAFTTAGPGYCDGAFPVFRFYGSRQNSHFYTVDIGECGSIRRNDPGWQFEGEAFGATMPVDGSCLSGQPLFRVYNNRAAQNDSNHRFTVKTAIRDEMVARGWISEGIAMCLYKEQGPFP